MGKVSGALPVSIWTGDDQAIFNGLHPDLQNVLTEAKRLVRASDSLPDFTLIVGYRSKTAQAAAYAKGNTKLKFGPHNCTPARAVDFLPNAVVHNGKIDWNDIAEFRAVAHLLMLAAHNIGVTIRWGGDWNRNGDENDEHGLRDFDHIELFPWQNYKGIPAA